MKKTLITAIFSAVLLLTGCAGDKESSSLTDSTPPDSASENTSQAQINSAANVATEETQPEVSALFTDYLLDGISDISVTGESLSPAEFADFEYAVKDLADYRPALNEFLTELDMPEITEQCARAYTLLRFFSSENLSGELNMDMKTYLEVPFFQPPIPSRYYASGIKYDSFVNAYLDVFTVGAAQRVFGRFQFFRSYNDQLWFSDSAMTGDISGVHEEYELITSTDSELLFRCTVFSAEDLETLEYYPEKRDDYITYTLDYKFVKTADGWRAEEFPIYSRTLDGIVPERY